MELDRASVDPGGPGGDYVWYENVELLGHPSVYDAKGEWATLYENGVRGEQVKYLGRKAPGRKKEKH